MRLFWNGRDIKRIMFLSILSSFALVLSIAESWFPVPLNIPGVKLGLSNIIILIALIFFSYQDALIIIFIKCTLSSLFTGGPVIFIFSILGGIISAAVMWLMLKLMYNWISLIGISITGAVVHNSVQVLVACFIMNDKAVMTYLPVLVLAGVIMGAFTGILSTFMVQALKRFNIISNF